MRYTLKTPYRDGTTHGVFAPHSRWRAQLTPGGRGSRQPVTDTRTPVERRRAMTWAQRLKRVFKLDLESCEGCGGQVRVLASIEDPAVIGKILAHRAARRPEPRCAGQRVRGKKLAGRGRFTGRRSMATTTGAGNPRR